MELITGEWLKLMDSSVKSIMIMPFGYQETFSGDASPS
jgi:hypothetical protein